MTSPADNSDDALVIGRVSGVFGVKGWVKLFSYTEPREAILGYTGWQLKTARDTIPGCWAESRKHGKTVIARLQGIHDRDTAERLVGATVVLPRSELPAAEDGRYYWSDLEGLAVENKDGRSLGRVAYLIATGAHDVLAVQGEQEILIPFVLDRYVLGVDLASGLIRVDWEWD